jgi:hypothetical protein
MRWRGYGQSTSFLQMLAASWADPARSTELLKSLVAAALFSQPLRSRSAGLATVLEMKTHQNMSQSQAALIASALSWHEVFMLLRQSPLFTLMSLLGFFAAPPPAFFRGVDAEDHELADFIRSLPDVEESGEEDPGEARVAPKEHLAPREEGRKLLRGVEALLRRWRHSREHTKLEVRSNDVVEWFARLRELIVTVVHSTQLREGVWAPSGRRLDAHLSPIRPVLPRDQSREGDIVMGDTPNVFRDTLMLAEWWRRRLETEEGRLLAKGLGIEDTLAILLNGGEEGVERRGSGGTTSFHSAGALSAGGGSGASLHEKGRQGGASELLAGFFGDPPSTPWSHNSSSGSGFGSGSSMSRRSDANDMSSFVVVLVTPFVCFARIPVELSADGVRLDARNHTRTSLTTTTTTATTATAPAESAKEKVLEAQDDAPKEAAATAEPTPTSTQSATPLATSTPTPTPAPSAQAQDRYRELLGGWVRSDAVLRVTRVWTKPPSACARTAWNVWGNVMFVTACCVLCALVVLHVITFVYSRKHGVPLVAAVADFVVVFIWLGCLFAYVNMARFVSRDLASVICGTLAIVYPQTLSHEAHADEESASRPRLGTVAILARLQARREQMHLRMSIDEHLETTVTKAFWLCMLLSSVFITPMVLNTSGTIPGEITFHQDRAITTAYTVLMSVGIVLMVCMSVLLSLIPMLLMRSGSALLANFLRLESPRTARRIARMISAEDDDQGGGDDDEDDDDRGGRGGGGGGGGGGGDHIHTHTSHHTHQPHETRSPAASEALEGHFRDLVGDLKSLRAVIAFTSAQLEPALTGLVLGTFLGAFGLLITSLLTQTITSWIYAVGLFIIIDGLLIMPALASERLSVLLPRVISSSSGPLARMVANNAALLTALRVTSEAADAFRMLGFELRIARILRVSGVIFSFAVVLVPIILSQAS